MTENLHRTDQRPAAQRQEEANDASSDTRSSNLVRVVHGPNEGCYPVHNKRVCDVRRALLQVFNIPRSAMAFVGGKPVSEGYRLEGGQVLEFIRAMGIKGLGELLTPEELQEQWRIDGQEYEELLVLGLPIVRFGTGAVRHPETAVDEFMRQLGNPNQSKPPELVGTPYVAERLGCTTVWITQMIRSGDIPPNCVVPGTGNGKPWKFIRVRIDEWLKRR